MIDQSQSAPKPSKRKSKLSGENPPSPVLNASSDAPVTMPETSATAAPPPNPAEESPVELKPFDLKKLRLSQDFTALSVKKALLTVPVKKPSKEWWVQTHPDPDYCFDTVVLELKDEDRETYLVDPSLFSDLSTESTVSPRRLHASVTSTGVVFLWPIRLPGIDGKLDDWSRSALQAAEMASKGQWVRVQSNMALGAYEVLTSADAKPPVWPTASMEKLMQTAFKDRYLTTLDHPVLKRLRGEL